MAEKKAARPRKAAPTHAKNRDMTALKAAFVEWLTSAYPEPPTQTLLAERMGVDAATLSDWKRDPYVVGLLEKVDERRVATWAQATARLVRIALRGKDSDAIQAVRELGKLWGRYPSEKHDVTVIDRVAYVQPGALREQALELYPELKQN